MTRLLAALLLVPTLAFAHPPSGGSGSTWEIVGFVLLVGNAISCIWNLGRGGNVLMGAFNGVVALLLAIHLFSGSALASPTAEGQPREPCNRDLPLVCCIVVSGHPLCPKERP